MLTKGNPPLASQQQWYKVLTELGISGLRIRAAGPGDEMAVNERGRKGSRDYQVVGILASDNKLYLPGGKFAIGDSAQLRKWLDNLGNDGPAGVTEPRSAFGLTSGQLQQITDDLKTPVTFETKAMAASTAVNRIASGLHYPLEADADARRGLGAIKIENELQGLASGTALAAIARSAGLALEPDRVPGGQFGYRLTKAQAGRQAWPIGWPPRESRDKVLPDLFERLNVEMSDIPVSQAADAIRERLKVPLIYDLNAMAVHGIDPAEVEANVPPRKTTYSQALAKVLLQAKLQYELRVDEADKPFLWVTTVKRVK